MMWIRNKSHVKRKLSSASSCPHVVVQQAEAGKKDATAVQVMPAILVSRDVDTQNMLLSSANVSLFFQQKSPCQMEEGSNDQTFKFFRSSFG